MVAGPVAAPAAAGATAAAAAGEPELHNGLSLTDQVLRSFWKQRSQQLLQHQVWCWEWVRAMGYDKQ